MKWDFVKPLDNERAVEEFESLIDYVFPESFKQTVKAYNAGTPEKDIFNTSRRKERELGYFLSFNKKDRNTIWGILARDGGQVSGWDIEGLDWRYIPFADDPSGNYICFDRTDDHVIFFNHETHKIEKISTTFEGFIDSLYTIELPEIFKKYFS